MIKPLDMGRIGEVIRIWLEANEDAHSFVPEEYWKQHVAHIRRALPEATVHVYEEKDEIQGFVGIIQGSYIAGLFVSIDHQGRGVGEKLLNRCKRDHDFLSLDVYAKNERAISFYRKHGFQRRDEKMNGDTKEVEYSMTWESSTPQHL
jgi:putative acetyltransferase